MEAVDDLHNKSQALSDLHDIGRAIATNIDRGQFAWIEGYDYWACERPEQPAQPGIWWDERCPKCRLAYEAAIVNNDAIIVITPTGHYMPRDAPITKWAEMGIV